jgi:hypothetical protein
MPSYLAKVEYVISTRHSYCRRTWTMNSSGQFAGKTESAVMKKLRDRHGSSKEITILSVDFR